LGFRAAAGAVLQRRVEFAFKVGVVAAQAGDLGEQLPAKSKGSGRADRWGSNHISHAHNRFGQKSTTGGKKWRFIDGKCNYKARGTDRHIESGASAYCRLFPDTRRRECRAPGYTC
jgi:hypothetical protein